MSGQVFFTGQSRFTKHDLLSFDLDFGIGLEKGICAESKRIGGNMKRCHIYRWSGQEIDSIGENR